MQICIYKFVFSCTFLCFWRYNKNISRLILGSTELDDETGHKCKMPHSLYRIFCTSVLGLPLDSWAITRSEAAFKNLILQDLDAMMYYFDTNTYYKITIFTCLTLFLVGADACIPHIINSVWGEDDNARLALGGPRGDLSLIRRHLLTLSKVAIHHPHLAHQPKHPHSSPHN